MKLSPTQLKALRELGETPPLTTKRVLLRRGLVYGIPYFDGQVAITDGGLEALRAADMDEPSVIVLGWVLRSPRFAMHGLVERSVCWRPDIRHQLAVWSLEGRTADYEAAREYIRDPANVPEGMVARDVMRFWGEWKRGELEDHGTVRLMNRPDVQRYVRNIRRHPA